MANLPSVEDLLAAGSHFGHQTQRWNPKMKPYILAEKNGIYVLNLSKTRDLLEEAGKAAQKISESGKTVLFVGTKPTARQCVLDAAAACKHFSVTNRWLGGMLTNFQTVRKSIKKIDKIDAMERTVLSRLSPRRKFWTRLANAPSSSKCSVASAKW